jgi:hypothetical protein
VAAVVEWVQVAVVPEVWAAVVWVVEANNG